MNPHFAALLAAMANLAGNVAILDVVRSCFEDMSSCLLDTTAGHGRRVGDIM